MPRRQGDGSENKLLAATPEDLSSNPWHTGKKQGMIVCACSPSSGGRQKVPRSANLANQ